MNIKYKDILETATEWLDNVDANDFLEDFLEIQEESRMGYRTDDINEAFERFLPYIEQPNFFGVVLSKDSRVFYGDSGLFNKAIDFFKGRGYNFIVNKQVQSIKFPSGAEIRFTSYSRICGMRFSCAMIIKTVGLMSIDIKRTIISLRLPVEGENKHWFLEESSQRGL